MYSFPNLQLHEMDLIAQYWTKCKMEMTLPMVMCAATIEATESSQGSGAVLLTPIKDWTHISGV